MIAIGMVHIEISMLSSLEIKLINKLMINANNKKKHTYLLLIVETGLEAQVPEGNSEHVKIVNLLFMRH